MSQIKYLKGECTECGGHIEFPADSAGLTMECPHCGKSTELFLATPKPEPSIPLKTIIWTGIAILVLIAGLAAAFMGLSRAQRLATRQQQKPPPPPVTETNALPEPEDPAAKAGFRISPIALEKVPGGSLIYAVGTLTNPSDGQRFGVKLQLDLLDASGQKLGTATDYQSVMEPNAEWQFRALVVDSKATAARLAVIKETQ
jgi:rRNA maturation protein Nop10